MSGGPTLPQPLQENCCFLQGNQSLAALLETAPSTHSTQCPAGASHAHKRFCQAKSGLHP